MSLYNLQEAIVIEQKMEKSFQDDEKTWTLKIVIEWNMKINLTR